MATKKAKRLPHQGAYTKLFPSRIEKGEVGVQAIIAIPEGTNPFPGDDKMVVVPVKELKALRLPRSIREMYARFGVVVGDLQYAPPSFNRTTQSWYVCDSRRNPNLRYGADDRFYALRDIGAGEELTVDYRTIG